MAVQHIPVDTSKRLGVKLRRCVDLGREFRDLLREVSADMSVMVDGSDYSHLEAQFGIPAGKGQTAKGEIDALLGKLENTNSDLGNLQEALTQVFTFFS